MLQLNLAFMEIQHYQESSVAYKDSHHHQGENTQALEL